MNPLKFSDVHLCDTIQKRIALIETARHESIVTMSPPFTCSLPLLRSLHWLPVRFKILFKINFKTLCEKQPVYLHSMLATSLPSRSLRLNNDNSLSVPRVKTNTGARAFHSCAPSLWNNLPLFVYSANSVEDTSLLLGLSPIDTSMPDSLLMLFQFDC